MTPPSEGVKYITFSALSSWSSSVWLPLNMVDTAAGRGTTVSDSTPLDGPFHSPAASGAATCSSEAAL